jgi:dTDP-4-amino-4,6-dideoxygalactose transaminase
VWAQYTLTLKNRDTVQASLKAAGVPSVVYYPRPLNTQAPYRGFPVAPGGAPASERLSASVLSLPMHPYLEPATQDRIVEAVLGATR